MSHSLLLIEQAPCPLDMCLACLDSEGDGVRWERAEWTSFAPESLSECKADLIVPVALGATEEARSLFEWVITHPVARPTLAVLPREPEPALLDTATRAADDFVLFPVRPEEFSVRVRRLLSWRGAEIEAVRDRLLGEAGLARLVGRDPTFARTVAQVPCIARSGVPVLITGETGTGKDLCARAIHHLSERRSRPFIPVDCGALPDHLFENELFGHARGAFTDAHVDQKGLVALAEGGTLFLDEVDALSHATQTKLLRFLQDRSYKPLGAERFLRADVSVIAASNRDLSELVTQHRFRSDLFFRLNVVNLHLSPLRERKGDIPLLAEHFVKAVCMEKGVQRKSLTASTLRVLASHSWPGNVRELYNVIQRAVLLGQGRQVLPSDVAIRSAQRQEAASSSFREARAQAIEAFEKAYVEDLLNRHAGNVTRAAREARKDRRAFGRLIKKLNIVRVS